MPPKRPQAPASKFCDLSATRGITICYEDFHGPLKKEFKGDKEELVLMIMGSAADLRKTADQQYIRQSEGYFRIMAYDHRNTGRSTIKDEPCTMEDYADDAAALLETVCPEKLPVYVIGISFGGMVAQHLAIRHPHLIKKLTLCCCGTGGETGRSYPIHEWYEPGMTVEERVQRKTFQANLERTEEWKKNNDRQWALIHAMVSRDEGCGADEPLRWEGVNRQLEARRGHDTTDTIGQLGQLGMQVLLCGSQLDGISPVKLMSTMQKRIGKSCEARLDFAYGHPFIAADLDAMAFINTWLRTPLPEGWAPLPRPANGDAVALGALPDTPEDARVVSDMDAAPRVLWEVVGGADKGGIIVRSGASTASEQEAERLSTGALIGEVEFVPDTGRLRYQRLTGTGPTEGWISIKLKDKDLAVRTAKIPPA